VKEVSRRDSTVGRAVDVFEHPYRAVGTPDNATAKESYGEKGSVNGLIDRSGKIEFVAKPMDVKKWS
jgi:hypothetical protein